MQAILFNFSKRLNSTKRPNDAEGVPVTVSIKQNVPKGQSSSQSGTETFLSHPTIWVQGDYTNYNYMKFKDRYYFVRDIQLTINNATVIYGEIDVLATYKEEILDTTAKVIYSSSDYNLDIDDARMKMTNQVDVESTSFRMFEIPFSNSGTYIVTAIGYETGAHSNAWIMTPEEYRKFCDFVTGADEEHPYLDGLLNSFLSPANAVSSVKWTPLVLPGNARSPVVLGNIQVTSPPLEGDILSCAYYTNRVGSVGLDRSITIPRPNGVNDYRKGSRFSSIYLSIPFCGIYPINADDVYSDSDLHVTYSLDWVTGDMLGAVSYYAEDDKDITLLTFSGNAYSDVPFGQIVNAIGRGVLDVVVGAATFAISSVARDSASTHNMVHKGESWYFNATAGEQSTNSLNLAFNGNQLISGIESASQKNGISGGSNSSALGYMVTGNEYLEVTTITHLTPETPSAIRETLGLPCNKTRQLRGLSGYCQTNGISIDVGAIGTIRDRLNAAVDNGIYIE